LIFADLKIPEDGKHKEYTKQSNSLIIDNLKKLSQLHSNIIIRIPLIPGVNDSTEDMYKFRQIIAELKGIKDIELLKYNYLASSKYRICGLEYNDFGNETQSDETIYTLEQIIRCRDI
jgi:pyruvate formate lyase activating enzyme